MKGQQGLWNSYVENHLLPRINGFELLMASYAMAHLKLDLLLKQTGYTGTKGQRFRIYLTNSLEEYHKDTGTLFANWLSAEANEANQIKRDAPVMIVAGNPPYSGESANKGEWIMNLMEDYKKEPGGKEKLKERNPKWINDDYVKFIRYGQHFIEKNGSGILAFINPHGFLDNPTFRGMRWNLLKTFDKIYTIDLHGNAKKKETAPDGSPDVNVFDIQQGVSINFFIKTGLKKENDLGRIFHFDLYGQRELKYKFLNENTITSVNFKELISLKPNFFFVPKDFFLQQKYEKGFFPNNLFLLNNVGIVTSKDSILIDDKSEILFSKIVNSLSIAPDYNLAKKITYRPFDEKFIYYDLSLVERGREKIMRNFLNFSNVGLVIGRQGQVVGSMQWNLAFITKNITDFNLYYRGGGVLFPLYLYPDSDSQLSLDSKVTRTPNLDMKIVKQIADGLGLSFVPEKRDGFSAAADRNDRTGEFAPIDLLDYIYAVLHSPTYRETYKEFLKIDFPRVPFPDNVEKFWKLVQLGGELRALHLMESPSLNDYITEYPIGGDNEVEKPRFVEDDNFSKVSNFGKGGSLGRVYINSEQYFDKVPEVAWNFYIGGYQPAQKWLKDRKGRTLEFEDILHYQKIIKALVETDRIMGEIDGVNIASYE
jgi:predicted helicase